VILDIFGELKVPIFRGQDLDRNQLGPDENYSIGISREKTLTSGRRTLVASTRGSAAPVSRGSSLFLVRIEPERPLNRVVMI